MDGPSTVRLQRRRGELPPDRLFVERRGGKRKEHPSVEDATRAYYVRQKRNTSISAPPSNQTESAVNSTGLPTASSIEARRTFHLKQPSLLPPSTEGSKSRKRKQNEASLPTVFEKRQRKFEDDAPTHHFDDVESQPQTPSAPPKRPGRGSAIRPQPKNPAPTKPEDENVAHRQQREVRALAEEMHQFALEELAKTPKPQIKTKPKLPPSRARALHEQQQSPAPPQRNDTANKDQDDDTMMDSDSEYVYDTYVLAPVPQPSNPSPPSASNPATEETPTNIGYLIITEADAPLWETYMHDLEGSDSEPTDEDDENAEDYYGADYPSDELATDDEFDRGGAAYGYRARRGSNDEQYNLNDNDDDEDEITWSDEEDMRMMNPFAAAAGKKERVGPSRVERQFAKYLDQRKRAEGEGEE
jgi:hypothetical protein